MDSICLWWYSIVDPRSCVLQESSATATPRWVTLREVSIENPPVNRLKSVRIIFVNSAVGNIASHHLVQLGLSPRWSHRHSPFSQAIILLHRYDRSS